MVSKAEQQTSSGLDTFKIIVAIAVLIAGIVGFYYFEDQSQLLRVLGILAVGAVAVGIVLTTEMGRNGWSFVKEARVEVRKVVWPTRQETLQSTAIVLFMVVLVAIMLWLFDTLLGWAVGQMMG